MRLARGQATGTIRNDDVDTTPPTIVSLGPVEPDPGSTPVADVTVTFSEPIDLATFDVGDVTLTSRRRPRSRSTPR